MPVSPMPSELVGTVEDFNPLWDYILVKVIEQEKVTAGGVFMPDNYSNKRELKRAKVIKAGKGAYRESGVFIPNPIKEGDIIYMMGHTAPFEVYVKVDGVSSPHFLLAGRDCVAVEKASQPMTPEQGAVARELRAAYNGDPLPCCPPNVGCERRSL